MTRAPTCCAPGTEVKGVRERDENKTGSDRRIFFSGGWLHLWQYTSYKREEENLGGRDLDLHTTDSHCENVTHTQSERASEWVSERASERTRPGTTEEPGDATMERALHTATAGEEGAPGSLG